MYDGNQLQTVTDAKDNLSGYPTGGSVFEYDLNGSMTKQQDKGISNIAYNLLDLPSTVTHTNGTIQYLYRADGTKLKKTASGVTTDYVDGFQYENGILKFVPTSEGYFNFENNTYIYHYTDHLGNIRLSYTKNGSSVAIIEESNFYPYGMKQENTVQTNPAYNYEHIGKEFQKETGWSDFGARMYMADIGRWGVIDPLAEKMRRHSPYNYNFNNPINFVDLDGMAPLLNGWDEYGHWDFDPNTTLMGGDFFAGMLNPNFNSFNFDYNITGGGGGSLTVGNLMSALSPTFQFMKGQEAYYKENYPAFYNFVLEILPKMVADKNFMNILSSTSGFSIEVLEKMFSSKTDYGLMGHNTSGFSNADYPYSSDTSYPINLVRINNEVLDWFEKADRDTKTIDGIKNLFYMTVLVGHEINHWGEAAGTRVPFEKTGLGQMGYNDAGDYFENKLLKDTYFKRGIGNPGSNSEGINTYIKNNYNMLYNIFNKNP